MSSAAGGAGAGAAASCCCSSSSKEPPPSSSLEEKGREVEKERVDAAAAQPDVSESSPRRAEEEEEVEEEEGIELGPRVSIKEQLEMDKVSLGSPSCSGCSSILDAEDESLRRWKEQLLGSVDLNSVGETLEPDVRITSLCIMSPGRPDVSLPLPVEPSSSKSKEPWFTLKEGSDYRFKFTFSVSNNIVSGLRYTNIVWKAGIQVDRTKEMLGTFSPQLDPYNYVTPEETTPSGVFARGSYSARTKFVDDDRKCYLEINYAFDIRREWSSSS
ncbi:hypothetical protein GUJ93_ZPchr0006g45258 [Zizania palustris]|uniref:Rho GDP-dissociation inhibitor 1 n=1 Tax=Zizania palustris TaxID=103762 RepID=A0A8J5SGR3_ZIZPA|nr:hypothetical protein GUJ93_ZPchr0006g45258 [Zizania palustris]